MYDLSTVGIVLFSLVEQIERIEDAGDKIVQIHCSLLCYLPFMR